MANVSDSLSVGEAVYISPLGTAGKVHIFVYDGTGWQEIHSSVSRESLKIDNVLTRQIDSANFIIRKYGDVHTFVPKSGSEIMIFDGLTKVFAGHIIKINQRSDAYPRILYNVQCSDYTRTLDRFLVSDTFQNTDVASIISSILTDKGLNTEFTTTNLSSSVLPIDYIAFKYEPFSSVLTQLADLFSYDWYVDYDKDIHFFAKEDNSASIDIEDDTGVYEFNSLLIRRDNSQVRNIIYVRGGEFVGDTVTSEFISDASQNTYTLPYRYDSMETTVTGATWTQGVDGTDDIATVDYIWNNEEKFIKFRGDRIPSDTSSIKVIGQPFLPVLSKVRDQNSINTLASAEGGTGEYEFAIIDKSINTKDGAKERALAELRSYSETLSEANFTTYTSGLIAGQRIRVNSTAHGIDEYFIINKVSASMRTESTFTYDISLVTTKTFGVIDFLRNLLLQERKSIIISENEIIDLIESYNEKISIVETTVTSQLGNHNLQTEEATISSTTTAQSIDYDVSFVLGPHVWSGEGSGDKKRVFLVGGSNITG